MSKFPFKKAAIISFPFKCLSSWRPAGWAQVLFLSPFITLQHLYFFQPFNLRSCTGALKWPPPSQMHKLPKLTNFVKALQIQTPIFTYSMPEKEFLSKCSSLPAKAQLRLLPAPLCLLFRSNRVSSAFQESNPPFLLSPQYAEPQAAQELLPHHQESRQGTPHNCNSTMYNSNSQKCHGVAYIKLLWESSPCRITRGDNFHFSWLPAPCTAPQKASLRHCSLAFPTVQMFVCFLSIKLNNGT